MAGLTLHFRVAFDTVWGQQLAVTGPSLDLGEGDLARAPKLSCGEEGGKIVWQGQVSIQHASRVHYKYTVLGESGSADEEEAQFRTVLLHESLRDGGDILLRDLWQVLSDHRASGSRVRRGYCW